MRVTLKTLDFLRYYSEKPLSSYSYCIIYTMEKYFDGKPKKCLSMIDFHDGWVELKFEGQNCGRLYHKDWISCIDKTEIDYSDLYELFEKEL